jgi:hypothetical protein
VRRSHNAGAVAPIDEAGRRSSLTGGKIDPQRSHLEITARFARKRMQDAPASRDGINDPR